MHISDHRIPSSKIKQKSRIKISYDFSIGLVTSVLGIVAAALDHPEIYLAFAILSMIITSFNLLVLCYFVYTAIKDSMDELHLPHRLGF